MSKAQDIDATPASAAAHSVSEFKTPKKLLATPGSASKAPKSHLLGGFSTQKPMADTLERLFVPTSRLSSPEKGSPSKPKISRTANLGQKVDDMERRLAEMQRQMDEKLKTLEESRAAEIRALKEEQTQKIDALNAQVAASTAAVQQAQHEQVALGKLFSSQTTKLEQVQEKQGQELLKIREEASNASIANSDAIKALQQQNGSAAHELQQIMSSQKEMTNGLGFLEKRMSDKIELIEKDLRHRLETHENLHLDDIKVVNKEIEDAQTYNMKAIEEAEERMINAIKEANQDAKERMIELALETSREVVNFAVRIESKLQPLESWQLEHAKTVLTKIAYLNLKGFADAVVPSFSEPLQELINAANAALSIPPAEVAADLERGDDESSEDEADITQSSECNAAQNDSSVTLLAELGEHG